MLGVLVLAPLASVVWAQPSLPRLVTELGLRVFTATCMANPTDEAAMRGWLQNNGFVPASAAQAAPFLRGLPGTAWLRSDPPAVALPLVVVTRAAGVTCEVAAPTADPEAAAAGFTALMTRLERPGLVVRKERDDATAPGGGPGRMLLYRVGMPPIEGGGFHFALSARPPVTSGLALLMTASRAPSR